MVMSLAALEILEEAQFPPAQARAIARVLESEAAVRGESLATKADFVGLRGEFTGLQTEFTGLQTEFAVLRNEFTGLRNEFNGLRSEFTELRSGFHELRSEFSELRQGVTADISRLELKIESARVDGVRWTFLAVMGQGAFLSGVMYFLLQNTR